MFFSILKKYINYLIDIYFEPPEPVDPTIEIIGLTEPLPENVFSYKRNDEEFVKVLVI